MTNPIGPLRWYAGLAVVFFGIVPAAMLSVLVARGTAAGQTGWLLVGGIPLVLAAIVYAVRGMTGAEPEPAAHRLNRSMALVAGADVIMLGGNALFRMAS